MTVGNLIALRQTNVVRMLAYSSIAQAGYMLAPLAVAGQGRSDPAQSVEAIVAYLLVYAAMNLGAFALVIALARKTRSAELSSFGGLFEYAPGLTIMMTFFVFSLAGIPPFAGWIAKLVHLPSADRRAERQRCRARRSSWRSTRSSRSSTTPMSHGRCGCGPCPMKIARRCGCRRRSKPAS